MNDHIYSRNNKQANYAKMWAETDQECQRC